MKYSIINHITSSCNYNCTYCDVIKDGKKLDVEKIDEIIEFIKINYKNIWDFKFFWWEPLLVFRQIEKIIVNTKKYIENDFFEIVTNTSLLSDKHLDFFSNNFKTIYLSIDNENNFNKDLFNKIINDYNTIEKKIYINLVIDPAKIKQARELFFELYNLWFKWYNLLPVYFTKTWTKHQLLDLSNFIREVLDISLNDKWLRMYWFIKEKWDDSKLSYNSLFLDTDLKVYYSDIVSTYMWKKYKKWLFIWNTYELLLNKLSDEIIKDKKKLFEAIENSIINNKIWQFQLHKIMDYFSEYLNKKTNL